MSKNVCIEIDNDVRGKYCCRGHISTWTHLQRESGVYAGLQGKVHEDKELRHEAEEL